MALALYSDLKASIANWLGRPGDTSTLPYDDLVALAEQRINFGSEDGDAPSAPLRIRKMEQQTDPTTFMTVAGTATLALPTGFLGMTENRECYLSTATPVRELEFATQSQITRDYSWSGNGEPRVFTFVGDNMRFGPTPDAAYGVVLGYYAAFTPLANGLPGATNWLLTNAPMVYLAAACMEALTLTRNMAMMPVWSGKYAAAIGGLMRSDQIDRWSGRLTMRPDHQTP